MLAIGDRVEITGRPGDANAGKYGDVVHIDTGIKPITQPVLAKLPKRELRYSVKLNTGEVLPHIMEHQLRKL